MEMFGTSEPDGYDNRTIYQINHNLKNENYESIPPEFFISIYEKTTLVPNA